MREYKTIRALRSGETIDMDGMKFKMDVDPSGAEKIIRSGDLYIAERNTGPQLLTADRVYAEGVMKSYVVPTTLDYPYDLDECVKVIEA